MWPKKNHGEQDLTAVLSISRLAPLLPQRAFSTESPQLPSEVRYLCLVFLRKYFWQKQARFLNQYLRTLPFYLRNFFFCIGKFKPTSSSLPPTPTVPLLSTSKTESFTAYGHENRFGDMHWILESQQVPILHEALSRPGRRRAPGSFLGIFGMRKEILVSYCLVQQEFGHWASNGQENKSLSLLRMRKSKTFRSSFSVKKLPSRCYPLTLETAEIAYLNISSFCSFSCLLWPPICIFPSPSQADWIHCMRGMSPSGAVGLHTHVRALVVPYLGGLSPLVHGTSEKVFANSVLNHFMCVCNHVCNVSLTLSSCSDIQAADSLSYILPFHFQSLCSFKKQALSQNEHCCEKSWGKHKNQIIF